VAVREAPTTLAAKQQLQEAMDEYVRQRIDRTLSPSDRATLGPAAKADPDEAGSERITQALDSLILEIAPQFGWRIFYSERIRERLAGWFEIEAAGPLNFENLGKQLKVGARLRLGLAKLRITTEHRKFKDSVVPEVRRLRNFIRVRQHSQNRALDDSELLGLALTELERRDCPYPVIQNNRASFAELLRSTPRLLLRLVNGGETPAGLADEWVARVTNQHPESARQAMSEAPSRGRRRPERPTPQPRNSKL